MACLEMLFNACYPSFPKCPKCRTKTTAPLQLEVKPYGDAVQTSVPAQVNPRPEWTDTIETAEPEQVITISAKRRVLESMLDEAFTG